MPLPNSSFDNSPHLTTPFFLLDVGGFTSNVNQTLIVDLGQSLRVPCPQHRPNYGASYSWAGSDLSPFKRDHHRSISPNGELFIMFVTQQDIDEIASLHGIRCTITGANIFYQSGPLMVKKRSPGKNSSFIIVLRMSLLSSALL